MKNQIMLVVYNKLFVTILILSIVPNFIFAQQQSFQNMYNRLDEIDFEINRLTLQKESIGMEFKKISDFSTLARPIIIKYDKLETDKRFWEDRLKFLSAESAQDLKKQNIDKDSAIKSMKNNIEMLNAQQNAMFGNTGIVSFFKVRCHSINDLQNEYNKTAEYYRQQKTEYDALSKQLGQLNSEKHDLETKLKYMGDQSINALEPTGCWTLAFGNHISEITIVKESEKYVGRLTVNNLQDYVDGQVVLILDRVSDNTFRGTEYTWQENPNGKIVEVIIPAMITVNTDNDFITWTSDQTVTMRRCR